MTSKFIPPELINEINDSKSLLKLEDGWDGPGSTGYQLKIWQKAVDFLKKVSKDYYNSYKSMMDIPYIDPGTNGDINIHWKTETFELFLTIPEADEKIYYYGDDYKKINVIEGSSEFGSYSDIIGFIGKFNKK